ncbi:hypothetical protein AMAG_02173 [Allomyces macrogynus ATCC 38327]|uniref:Beta-lactamase-related domain-containing protein n=1 Tax=Allomyces macrogynus (strain ATCC 38327) TaxID=578462 RepID=A0A0L0S190_ALLM3|nr:hypothetical protein AMAG_02173 [Allomyces macrogynus ATCC 38327]|eukprot:KNE56352.1 hypothetical protein AMAG_02173 [Allomyces macrogynus ATCC 38327]
MPPSASTRPAPARARDRVVRSWPLATLFVVAAALVGTLAPSAVTAGGSTDQLASVSSKSVAAFVEDFASRYVGSTIPGLAVAVVKDTKTVYSGGFGVANVGTQEPMHADTLVRVGSISQLVTATAVLSLRDNDRLASLDDTVESLAPGIVPPSAKNTGIDQPLTVRHLLAHVSGLEEKVLGVYAPRHRAPGNTSAILGEFPKAVRNPGVVISPNHHAYALLGQVVANAAEQPYDEYASENILKPLKMDASTFRPFDAQDPVMSAILEGNGGGSGKKGKKGSGNANVAMGHTKLGSAAFVAAPDLYMPSSAAGGLATTASDMAQLLKMVVNDGTNGAKILTKDAAKEMRTTQVRSYPPTAASRKASSDEDGAAPPPVPGTTLGWFEHGYTNGVRVLMHPGEVPGFASLAFVIPSDRLGVFLSINANDGHLRMRFVNEFVRKFGSKSTGAGSGSGSGKSATRFSRPNAISVPNFADFAKHYKPTTSAYYSFEYLLSVPNQISLSVSPTGQSLLLTATPMKAAEMAESTYELVPTATATAPGKGNAQKSGTATIFTVVPQAGTEGPFPHHYVAMVPAGSEANAPHFYLITNLLGHGAVMSYEPITATESLGYLTNVTTASSVLFAAYLVLWMLMGVYRAVRGSGAGDDHGSAKLSLSRLNLALARSTRLENLTALTCLANLGFPGLVALGTWKSGGIYDLFALPRLPAGLRIVFFSTFLVQIMTVALGTYVVQEGHKHSKLQAVSALLVAVASLTMTVAHFQMRLWVLHV